MIKVILSITFLLCMIIFILFIMMIGFKQNETGLLYLGLGLPVCFYLIIEYLKFINKITVEKEFVVVKNPVFGEKKIQYADIEYWKEIHPTYREGLHRKLILKTQNKKKVIILEDIDYKKYEMLRVKLKSDWKTKEIIYKY